MLYYDISDELDISHDESDIDTKSSNIVYRSNENIYFKEKKPSRIYKKAGKLNQIICLESVEIRADITEAFSYYCSIATLVDSNTNSEYIQLMNLEDSSMQVIIPFVITSTDTCIKHVIIHRSHSAYSIRLKLDEQIFESICYISNLNLASMLKGSNHCIALGLALCYIFGIKYIQITDNITIKGLYVSIYRLISGDRSYYQDLGFTVDSAVLQQIDNISNITCIDYLRLNQPYLIKEINEIQKDLSLRDLFKLGITPLIKYICKYIQYNKIQLIDQVINVQYNNVIQDKELTSEDIVQCIS